MLRRGSMTAFHRLSLLVAVLMLAGCGRSTPSTPGALPTATSAVPAAIAASLPAIPAAEPTGEELPEGASKTLSSLEQVDGYPLYTMQYYGSYMPWQTSVQEGSPVTRAGATVQWACSLFAAMGDSENRLYGRNFDWAFSPALFLFTDPADGYASVSMVDIAYLGFDGERARTITGLPLAERESLLQAPWLPFDGMNEAGLAVGMAAVPGGNAERDPAKPTIGSLGVIREMLDHAGSVDEAVALLQRYNIDFSGGPPLHYLLADRSGRAALVEFYSGKVHILSNDGPWLQSTNFLLAEAGGAVAGKCWRYDMIGRELAQAGGKMTAAQAMGLLTSVAQPNTQWSVVYGMSSGQVRVAMGQRYEAEHSFSILPDIAVP